MQISDINIYPIKSLGGISVDSAVVQERGLRHDRRWMLTDREGIFMTQREFPRMALVEVEIDGYWLYASADAFGTVEIPFEPDRGERQRVTIWNSVCDAEVYRGAISEWFSDVLGTACQLVRMPDATQRHINPIFDRGRDIVSFADGYPIMVVSEASLDDLNKKLSREADKTVRDSRETDEVFRPPLPMNRFRPNLVVSDSEPYAEDNWSRIRISEAVFRSTKPCERCVITTVNQSTGEFTGKEPLKTLATYRMAKDVIPDRFES
nr:MOSC domain-containing protein [Blastocatellia bacterium]